MSPPLLAYSLSAWVIQVAKVLAILSLGFVLGACQVSPPGTSLTPQGLASLLESGVPPVILDVRSPAEYAAGHIPHAQLMPYQELPSHLNELTPLKHQVVVVYCARGVRAKVAIATLQAAGFRNILRLEGDLKAWQNEALPIVIPGQP